VLYSAVVTNIKVGESEDEFIETLCGKMVYENDGLISMAFLYIKT